MESSSLTSHKDTTRIHEVANALASVYLLRTQKSALPSILINIQRLDYVSLCFRFGRGTSHPDHSGPSLLLSRHHPLSVPK